MVDCIRKQNYKIVILTEMGKTIGTGHFVRTTAICEKLIKNEINLSMLLYTDDFYSDKNFPEYVSLVNWYNHINELVSEDDIVILDSYNVDIDVIKTIEKCCHKLLIIDDNDRLEYNNMTILNPNYFGEFLLYPITNNNTYFIGKEYTTLRKEFYLKTKNRVKKQVSSVMITMGGTDVKKLSVPIIEYVKTTHPEVSLKIVVTDAYEDLQKIDSVKRTNDSIIKNATATEMSNLMSTVDFAISAGGGTCNELIKKQCPAMVVNVADNQDLNVKYLSENGLIARFDENNLDRIEMMFDYSYRVQLQKRMQEKDSEKCAADLILEMVENESNKG